MASIKNKMFDEAETILDQYAWYVTNRVLTFNEAVEILCDSKKVTSFFDKEEIEATISFELQKGQTIQ
tara:strand:+ start:748 stop:951 length:204 start_codon:yes stop_codon:yes gene_type:complete